MAGLWLDIRVASRALRRARTITFVAVGCLALGIGANVAVFSVVRAVLLQELPFPEPDRLVSLWVSYGPDEARTRFFVSPQQFMEIRDRNVVLDAMAASRVEMMSLDEGEYPTEVTGARVTPSLFGLVGAEPITGRTFSRDDEAAGALIAVISEGLWSRSFARRTDILGAPLRLAGEQYEIIGVLPRGKRVPPDVDVWIPLGIERAAGRDRTAGSLTVTGRLALDANLSSARDHLDLVANDIAAALPDRNANLGIGIEAWQDFLVEDVRPALLVLMIAVSGVLALAVSNVVSLLMVRARAERRHQALRLALGATTGRVLRYLAIENGMLTSVGCLVGVVAAYATLPALLSLQPDDLSPFRSISLDSASLMVAVFLACLVTAITTLLTAWHLRQSPLLRHVREGSAGRGLSRNALLVQRALVIGQIAASVVLFVGSSLFVRSFLAMQRVDPGFESDDVLVVRLGLPPSRSATHEERVVYLDEVLATLRAIPGVFSVGAAHVLPVADIRWGMGFNVEGQVPSIPSHRHVAVWRLVTPGYYDAMAIRLIRGRSFAERDRFDTEPVAVVSQSLAAEYWPGEDPIGKRVKRGTYEDPTEPWRTVIGVITDVSDSALAGRPRASLHFPYTQYVTNVASRVSLVVRVDGEPRNYASALVDAVRRVHGAALISEVAPYDELLGGTMAHERFNTLLMGIFSAIGLGLAAVGIYGVVSYTVSQRRAEFGIRMALGAEGRDVRGLMLRTSSTMASLGVGVGIIIAYVASPAVQTLLRTGNPRAPLAYILAAAVLMVTTIVAAWIPTRRATRTSLSETLRP